LSTHKGDYSDEENNYKSKNNNRKSNDKGEKGEKWVAKHEYDELSQLCDKLLGQQDKLQSELKEQATIIKALFCIFIYST
jgi:major membrane immunogen (membrane-anchored lipoprotein)